MLVIKRKKYEQINLYLTVDNTEYFLGSIALTELKPHTASIGLEMIKSCRIVRQEIDTPNYTKTIP